MARYECVPSRYDVLMGLQDISGIGLDDLRSKLTVMPQVCTWLWLMHGF